MDIAALAATVGSFLAPFLPYLLKWGDKAAEEAAKKIGGDAWEKAKALWAKLRPHVEAKAAAQEAVQDVAQNVKDTDAQTALRQQLKKLLAADATLAGEIARMVAEAEASGTLKMVTAIGDKLAIAAGQNVIIQGDIATDQAKIDKRKGQVFVDGTVHGDVVSGDQLKRKRCKRRT